MIRRIRWVCWIAAWSFWAWCGFGLARELPRDLGPEVLAVPKGDAATEGERILGFLADSDDLVTNAWTQEKGLLVRVRDGRTGVLVREAKAGTLQFINMGATIEGVHYSPRLGFVLHEPDRNEPSFVTLDLRTGRTIEQPHACSQFGAFHPRAPLILTYDQVPEGARENDDLGAPIGVKPDRVEVVDARTGNSVFSWTGPQMKGEMRERCGKPFFSIDGTLVMIPTQSASEGVRPICLLEVWSLTTKTRLLSLPNRTCYGPQCTSAAGRIVCQPTGYKNQVEVIDIPSGKCVFRRAAVDDDEHWWSATLTSDGRTLFQESTGARWDVDRQSVVQRIDRAGGFDNSSTGDVLGIWQDWSNLPEWLAPYFESFAPNHSWRDLRTGALLYRCRQTMPLGEARVNAAGTRIIDENGDVRAFPPPPNWPLLALCQAILALPFVLTWAGMHWRRRRLRARAAG